ncbi:hypothetical protein VVR12_01705 [Rothia sp. LK2588]|uniref:hypothetical protein n=1 Tax=Rothia sp. LK2588 TaxID=3114369 RepID=UPI0034CF3109
MDRIPPLPLKTALEDAYAEYINDGTPIDVEPEELRQLLDEIDHLEGLLTEVSHQRDYWRQRAIERARRIPSWVGALGVLRGWVR